LQALLNQLGSKQETFIVHIGIFKGVNIHHPSSIIHHPSSIIHHPSSIIHHPSSITGFFRIQSMHVQKHNCRYFYLNPVRALVRFFPLALFNSLAA
jgi:hypothetical protein